MLSRNVCVKHCVEEDQESLLAKVKVVGGYVHTALLAYQEGERLQGRHARCRRHAGKLLQEREDWAPVLALSDQSSVSAEQREKADGNSIGERLKQAC